MEREIKLEIEELEELIAPGVLTLTLPAAAGGGDIAAANLANGTASGPGHNALEAVKAGLKGQKATFGH